MKTHLLKSAVAVSLLMAGLCAWLSTRSDISAADNLSSEPHGTYGGRAADLSFPAFPDVGPVFIDEPWDTAWCTDTVPVAAIICNFGDTTLPFDVEALIDTLGFVIYADTQALPDLGPGACSTLSFTDWYVPEVEGFVGCMVTVTTMLASDIDPENDTLRKPVVIWCANYRDVQVSYIAEPWDTVWCGDTSQVAAILCNWGDTVETFGVEAVIDSGGVVMYTDTQSVAGLEPDSCMRVDFTGWPVPGGHLVSYTTTVATLLSGDMNPSNDTLRTSSANWCPGWRDIALESITAPPDSVFCDSLVQVRALIRNLGESAETFEVEALVSDTSGVPIYSDTSAVSGLLPDSIVDLVFLSWSVPATDSIWYDVAIATLLPLDNNPGNDSAAKTVFSRCQPTGIHETRHGPDGPAVYKLGLPVPSPARERTSIGYMLPCASRISLRIFDLRGTVVRTLVEDQAAGHGSVQWNGRDSENRPAPSGIYFYEFSASPLERGFNPFCSAGKLVLLK